MSVELQHVKRRIASTRQIRKVTSAMQRVAAARLVNDRRAMENSRRYTDRLRDVIGQLVSAAPEAEHPLLHAHTGSNDAAVVVFGSDRGLCGAFNTLLMDALGDFVAHHASGNVHIVAVGKVIARRCRRAQFKVLRAALQPARNARADLLDSLTDELTDAFLRRRFGGVFLLYANFVTALRQEAALVPLLPVEAVLPRANASRGFAFEPQADELLGRLVAEYVRQSVDFAFLSSLASENAARQEAMGRATDNAGEILSDLTLRYSRLRQESITTEMIELSGGGAA